MAMKEKLAPFLVISNGDMSQATITSAPTVIQGISMLSYAYSWTGSAPIGTVSVQLSNDFSLNSVGAVSNTGTWNTISFSLAGTTVSSAPVSGNTGNGMIDIALTGAYAVRTVYTKTSGTGTLQATICGKTA